MLPETAFITNFTMEIGNKIIHGEVKEKETAKQEYNAAVSAGKSAGLISKKPRETNSFKIAVNVAAQEKIIFNLTCQEILTRAHGMYKHVINLKPYQKVDDIAVNVKIFENAQINTVRVPVFGSKTGEKSNKELQTIENDEKAVITNSLITPHMSVVNVKFSPKSSDVDSQSGQLVVLCDVDRPENGGQLQVVNGYFVHFFAPQIQARGSKSIVFCLDKSWSMMGRKFEQTKEAMKTILNDLNPDDRFFIFMFSDEVDEFRFTSVPATKHNIIEAVAYINNVYVKGMTNIYHALQRSIQKLRTENNNALISMIIFMTDGQPMDGETNPEVIVDGISNDNDKNYAIHGIAFGDDADFNLVQRISSRNKGLARKVYEDSDASFQLTGFFAEISNPLLTNVTIQYLNESVDVNSIVQDFSYNYYDGGEITVVGKLNHPETSHPMIDAKIFANSNLGPLSFQTKF